MPELYYLNPPPNPFWDFVSGLEDHPFFAGTPARPRRHHGRSPPPPAAGEGPANAHPEEAAQPELSEKARGKQATVEDPPEVDPATIQPDHSQDEGRKGAKDFRYRGRGRFGKAFEDDHDSSRERREARHEARTEARCDARQERRGHPCRGGRDRPGWNGPPPFMFGHPFFARPPFAPQGPPGHEHRGPPGHPRGPPPPPGTEHRGPPGPHPFHPFGPPPHARGPHGPHRGPSPPHQPRPGFDLGDFLNKLGNRLGVDLSNAAEGLGLTADRFTAGKTGQDVDFEPRADIFENKNLYTVHLSLPGAKKSDVGVDYDGEHSILRITGVVHRPDVDEQMLSELTVDGRKRETGVFEKAIRLGTKRDPASIDVAGISAKMTDGVLVVKIPKVEKVHQKREVPISADPLAEGHADYEDEYSEKPVLFDAEEQASVAGTDAAEVPKGGEVSLIDMKDSEVKDKQHETDAEEPRTVKVDEAEPQKEQAQPVVQDEQLPAYSTGADHNEEDDWEKFSDASGEGDYIKINVD